MSAATASSARITAPAPAIPAPIRARIGPVAMFTSARPDVSKITLRAAAIMIASIFHLLLLGARMGKQPPSPQGKRLALFLDGTWNTVSDNTNVWRMRALIAAQSADGAEQRAYYSTGLGTKFGERLRGGAFGRGINTAIISAYEWLIENYADGDEIFIFGFSRGAYTARSLSGFIAKCGLLQSGAPLGVNQLYKRYRSKDARTIMTLHEAPGRADFSDEETWMMSYARVVPIKFVGVYDTVGALGVPFPSFRKLFGGTYQFLNTGLRRSNDYAFHAIAIDEHRKSFSPTLWTTQNAANAAPRSIGKTEQRWFVGAHANVGGGCFTDPLAQRPLDWLAGKAESVGLAFKASFDVPDEAKGPIADSFAQFMWGLYRIIRLGRRHYRGIDVPPPGEGSAKTINETIDHSVFARARSDAGYRPPNLLAWAKAKGVSLHEMKMAVRADDPATTAD
jgi:hypothetical protein